MEYIKILSDYANGVDPKEVKDVREISLLKNIKVVYEERTEIIDSLDELDVEMSELDDRYIMQIRNQYHEAIVLVKAGHYSNIDDLAVALTRARRIRSSILLKMKQKCMLLEENTEDLEMLTHVLLDLNPDWKMKEEYASDEDACTD